MSDLAVIQEMFSEKILSASQVGDIYEFELKGLAPPKEKFKVKLKKQKDGGFVALQSHYVHRSGLAGPHYVYITGENRLEALREVFLHGLMNYDLQDSGTKWVKEPDF